MYSLLNILLLFSIFQLSLAGVSFLFFRGENSIANKFLALFLISKAICFSGSFLGSYIESPVYGQFLILLSYSFDLLLGPSIYFYIKKSTYNEIRFNNYFYANFLPFAVGFMAVWIFCFPVIAFTVKNYSAYKLFGVFSFYGSIEFIVYSHFVVYSSLSIKLLSSYSKYVMDNFSNADVQLLRWLRILLGGFVFIWVINILDILMQLRGSAGLILSVATIGGIFVFANLIVIISVLNPEIFRDKIHSVKPKYEKTLLDESEKEKYAERLNKIITDEKIYLSGNLSLTDLAEKLNVQNHVVSQIINTTFGKNFYDYINFFRVEECKKLLTSSSHKSKTVLEIAFGCGFNSKSVFNESFKKNTGLTPTEFRKRYVVG